MFERFDTVLDGFKANIKAMMMPFSNVFNVFSNVWVSGAIIVIVFALLLIYCRFQYGKLFKENLKKPKVLVFCSLMIALNIVLGYFQIWLSSYIRIGFGFMTQPIVASLFGPLMACMTGIAQDIITYLLNPAGGAFLPTYSICVGISGMIYGIMLYNKPVKLWRVFVTKLLIVILGNCILNSIALAPTVGSGFIGILPARIIKNLIMLPIQTVVVYIILKFSERIKAEIGFES